MSLPCAHISTDVIRRADGSTFNALWLWETSPPQPGRQLVCIDLDHTPTRHALTFPGFEYIGIYSLVVVFRATDRSTLLFYSLRYGYGCVAPVRDYEEFNIAELVASPIGISFTIREGRFKEVFMLVLESPPQTVPMTKLESFPRVTPRLLVTVRRDEHYLSICQPTPNSSSSPHVVVDKSVYRIV